MSRQKKAVASQFAPLYYMWNLSKKKKNNWWISINLFDFILHIFCGSCRESHRCPSPPTKISHYTHSTAWVQLNWSKNSRSSCLYFITTPETAYIQIQYKIREFSIFIRGFWNIVAGQSLCRTGRSSLLLSDWLLYISAAVIGEKKSCNITSEGAEITYFRFCAAANELQNKTDILIFSPL